MTKILVEGFNTKLDQMKEMITKLKDRALKFIQLEEQKEKKKKNEKSEDRLRNLWDTIK